MLAEISEFELIPTSRDTAATAGCFALLKTVQGNPILVVLSISPKVLSDSSRIEQ